MIKVEKVGLKKKTEEAESRSYVYGFLSLVYRQEPTREFLAQIRRPEFVSALNELGLELDEAFCRSSEEELLEELTVEYTRLFLGPGKHISPHESVHREGEGLLWGDSTAKVKAFIESSGLKYASDFKGIPDHISVELEFMHRLLKEEVEAREKNDPGKLKKLLYLKKRFVDEHLLEWIPRFADKIAKETKLNFYRKIAILTKEFILSETRSCRAERI